MKKYTEQLLPKYINATKRHEFLYGRGILQEDNDPSHGTRSHNNLARQAKEQAKIETLLHPAQSPDLNAAEDYRISSSSECAKFHSLPTSN